MDGSQNRGTPKSSILIGFSIMTHPFWGTPIFGNTQMAMFGGFKDVWFLHHFAAICSEKT